ncbi:hypothetical protein LHYA1_G004841 [Lachnellula hyalina]|uniref:DUF1996 domain-containing protein n=1 Tax=Lachnellula hyalina TaxID=1316788 RepID=A0A8H8R4U7_9HELO|nr:uncharacterized protein LHYA1_G004841 [Lachnellula hyalina]TVY26899.1 hypothetical protein LHYA1_G004841 [Lachnellula hyalina]
MRSSTLALKATTLLLFAAYANAFWRMPCVVSGLARIDPLKYYGTISEHMHAIHGSSGFSDSAGTTELLAGECTSCQVTQDKSAYWTPALYFQNSATSEFSLVNQVGGMLAYYLLRPNAGSPNVTAFPHGFEMIAGDTNQREFNYPVPDVDKSNWNVEPYNTQEFKRQAALGFNCLDYTNPAATEGSLYRHSLPDKAYLDAHCKSGVRFELMFPSCWNGKSTPDDKKSHMAYPSLVGEGDCPPDFPIRLNTLFFETIWDTHAFAGTDGQFVIANGDPTGNGYHGDFIMGWDEQFLQDASNQCTDLSGKIEDCPLFTIQPLGDSTACNIAESNIPAPIAKELAVGGATTLPGNPPIVYTGYASDGVAAAPSSSSAPAPVSSAPAASTSTSSEQPSSSVASDTQQAPSAPSAATSSVDPSQSATEASSTIATTSPSPAVTPAPAMQSSVSTQTYFSTEYQTKGQDVVEVLWVEDVVTVTATALSARKRHLHKHRRGVL